MLREDGAYLSDWQDYTVLYNEGYASTMMDFHTHSFYEVSLILSGDVVSALSDRSFEGRESRLVLTAPGVPHWMRLSSPSLYSRVNLYFSSAFLEDYVPEWRTLSEVFGARGRVILLSGEESAFCKEAMLAISRERDSFRARLAILSLLSHVREMDREARPHGEAPPPYIVEALAYIDAHYGERLVAAELAWHLGIGRTTLMTAFKRYTGVTLSEHVLRTRVRRAVELLAGGYTQEDVAERVGLGCGGGLIRAFRHLYGVTPREYMKRTYQRKGEL